jgi:ABC-type amino acid transport substrate-binding protein
MGTDTMSNRRILLLALGSGAGLLSLGVRAQTPGAAAPAAPGGFADPQGAPRRLPPPDVDPVWRGPSVDTLATLRRRGLMRVGVVPIEPMVMQDAKGAWLGFSVDLARRLADDLGVRLELVPTSWPRVIPDLLERQYDVIITGLWITAPRALVVNFTQPTVTEGLHLVASSARAARRLKRSDYNQSDVTLAVGAGTPQERVARLQFPRARLAAARRRHRTGGRPRWPGPGRPGAHHLARGAGRCRGRRPVHAPGRTPGTRFDRDGCAQG